MKKIIIGIIVGMVLTSGIAEFRQYSSTHYYSECIVTSVTDDYVIGETIYGEPVDYYGEHKRMKEGDRVLFYFDSDGCYKVSRTW